MTPQCTTLNSSVRHLIQCDPEVPWRSLPYIWLNWFVHVLLFFCHMFFVNIMFFCLDCLFFPSKSQPLEFKSLIHKLTSPTHKLNIPYLELFCLLNPYNIISYNIHLAFIYYLLKYSNCVFQLACKLLKSKGYLFSGYLSNAIIVYKY